MQVGLFLWYETGAVIDERPLEPHLKICQTIIIIEFPIGSGINSQSTLIKNWKHII